MTVKPKAQLVPELACQNASLSRNFYVEVLGFSVLYERPDQGFCYLERQGAEIMIEQLSKNTWKSGEMRPPFGRGLHFQIMTTGLEELYDSCKTNNVKIFREPEDAWYRADDLYVGQRQFVICDPDGYMLRFAEELCERIEPPQTGRKIT